MFYVLDILFLLHVDGAVKEVTFSYCPFLPGVNKDYKGQFFIR
jgi:hypothetical protein